MKKQHRQHITVRLPPDILAAIDREARARSETRTDWIQRACRNALRKVGDNPMDIVIEHSKDRGQ